MRPRDSVLRQAGLLLGAVVCSALGVWLLIDLGLPQRGDFTGETDAQGRYRAPEIGVLAPPIQTRSFDGQIIDLDALNGSPVVVNFWASWCAPCAVEMPELQKLYEAHANEGLRILAVNLGEEPAYMRAWIDSFGLTFDILPDPDQEIARRYAFRDPPQTFIIAPDGRISRIFFGPASTAELQDALSAWLDF